LAKGVVNFQAAPVLWLWIEKAITDLFGMNAYALRLFACLSSVASLLLFYRLMKYTTHGAAFAFCVAVFSVSHPLIRYAASGKPYASDVLVTVLLLFFAVRYLREPNAFRWRFGLIAFIPIALGLSFPAVFIAGGVSLTLLYFLWKDRTRRGLGVWVLYNLVLIGSFLSLFLVIVLSQMESTLGAFQDYWKTAFPPVTSPLSLLAWMVKVHSGHSFAYPQGGNHGGSALTLLLCLFSIGAFLRARRWGELIWLLVPFGLALLAAALEYYPYGGKYRFLLFLSPLICTMVAVGMERLTSMVPESPDSSFSRRRGVAIALLGIHGALGVGSIIRDLVRAGFTT
jgi:4-amino-4-deoxy-L-arabinose transferase-like glycosyltransferase